MDFNGCTLHSQGKVKTPYAREGAMAALLDPKNDYVFKRLFADNPELAVALINDLRPDLPRVIGVEILNPADARCTTA